MLKGLRLSLIIVFLYSCNAHKPARFASAVIPNGYRLVFQDEFKKSGRPNSEYWTYEEGFVRNFELQYYRPQNAFVSKGRLVIQGLQHKIPNKSYDPKSRNWRASREWAEYTSASVTTKGKRDFHYGIFEFRAKIDTSIGLWPAIWMLGAEKPWPENGEIDILEFFRIDGEATMVTSFFWLGENGKQTGKDSRKSINSFIEQDPYWTEKFHIWKMDWTPEYIRIYLDDNMLNEIDLSKTYQPDGYNPFHHPHYLLINLAIGAGGGDPSATKFPRKLEVDYVRVFQKKQ